MFARLSFSRGFASRPFNQPPSANILARPAGITSFMRLPIQHNAQDLDACFVGIPFDTATSNRPGTRFGPRQMRTESVMLRPINGATDAKPFDHIQVADVGDVDIVPYSVAKTAEKIRNFYDEKIIAKGCIPLTLGGDHFITYPILSSVVKGLSEPVALIHVDAHADTSDEMAGEKLAHGTPFRRAFDDGLLLNDKVFQIGLRGTIYTKDDYQWARDQGWTVVQAHECFHKSLVPLMNDIRAKIGPKTPTYLTFDIDGIDPGFCPGTGTPEIGGLTTIQGLEIIRGCQGLNIVGADLVEVAPMYDTTGNTALTGANLLFEMLCILPKVKH